MKIRWISFSIIISIAISGCVSVPNDNVDRKIKLLTNLNDTPNDRPQILLMGGYEGVLVRKGDCLLVRNNHGYVVPVWPVGTEVNKLDNKIKIVLPDNRGVAVLGKSIQLSGSSIDKSKIIQEKTLNINCIGAFFAVSNIERAGS